MADNRSKILHIALNLFAAHGYDAVGVQQIVTASEVTKPTLYHYFKSKRGLFDAIIAEKSVNLLQELTQASDYQHDIVKCITDVTRCYLDFLDRQPMFYRLMLVHWFMPSSSEIYESISSLHRQQFTLIEQMFLAASEDHGNMRGRHQQYAISLRGMIDTYVGLSLQGHVQVNNDETIYRIVHQFMHGIFS